MRTIGLTGSIACGKSNVSAVLRELGAAVVDGDLLSRELTAPGGPALPAIREAFGGGVFHADGTLNRRALGDVVFASDAARQRLDGLMQPLLRSLILRRMEEARAGGAKICVLDMPLLFEAGLDALCDTVWCVHLPREEPAADGPGWADAFAGRGAASQPAFLRGEGCPRPGGHRHQRFH